jgi:hypothetical protein
MSDTDMNGQRWAVRALITNPEVIIERETASVWHQFPTTTVELQRSLAAIRLDGTVHRHFSVSAYDTVAQGLAKALPKEPDLNELNYLALCICGMSADGITIFGAAMQTGEYKPLRDIINVTENTGCFYLQPAFSPEELGDFLIERDKGYFSDFIGTMKNSGDEGRRELADYIERLEACVDRKALGWHKAAEEQGHFTTAGYLTRTNGDYIELYNTPSDIPPEYRVFAYPGTDMIRTAIERKTREHTDTECEDVTSEHRPSVIDHLMSEMHSNRKQEAAVPDEAPRPRDEPSL